MKRTLVVSIALVGALGLGLWLWSGMSGSRALVQQAPRVIEAEAARASDAPSSAELAPAPALHLVTTPVAEVAPEHQAASADERTPLADVAQRWVEGVVLFPEGTPADEQARVVVRDFRRGNGPQPSAPVGPDGRFRLAVGAKESTVQLGLEARYLRLAEEASHPIDEPVTLRPRLGGRIEGRVIVPSGSTAQGGVVELNSDSDSDSYGEIELGAEPVFAFGGLEAGSKCDLSYQGPTLIGEAGGIRIEAGRAEVVELVLALGVVLAGSVRDEAGRPLEGAYVSVHEQDGRYYTSRESAADGSFRLDAILPGELVVDVSHDGFLTGRFELGALDGGTKREDLALVLTRGKVIAGRVLWPDGTPARAWVEIENETLWGGRDPILEMTEGGDQRADSEGRFRLTGMGAGPYRVSAKATRREEKTVTSELTGHERQKTERTALYAEAEHVAPGTEDLTLKLSEGLTVRGRVVDDRGLAVEEFVVEAYRVRSREVAPSEPIADSFDSGDGAFELSGVLPGEWEFTAQRPGERLESEPVRVSLPTAEVIVLVLPRPASVSGVVLDARGAPAANARVVLASDDDDSTSRADERGAFTLANLRPGPVALSAQGTDDAPGERLELELAPGEERTDVVLHLREGATITGEVVDSAGRPEVGQTVLARDDSGIRVRTETDAQGRFALPGLAEGEVELIAETVEGVVLRRSIALRARETVHVRLALGERALVRLTGRISAGGEPLEDALFHAYGRGGDTGDSQGEVDEEGAYAVLLPGPGTYSLYVHGSGARSLSYEEVLVVPEVSELTHDVLIPIGRISGRVTSVDGRPLAEVEVGSEPGRHEAGAGFGSGRTWTDAEGRYELVLPPGRHSVRAGGEAGSPPEKSYAAKRVEGLVLAADAHLRDVNFVLAEGGAIRGRLQGAAGDTELWSFEPAGPRPLGYADDDGSFSIGGLTPGPYLIGAVGERAATREPVPVEVEVGKERELVLELVPATQVHVRARDASGAPLGCEIRAAAADGRPCPQRTGTLGEAWIGALLPGRYVVRATREGRTVERTVEITGPSETPLEVVLVFE